MNNEKRRVIRNIDGVLVATKNWITRDGKLFGFHGYKSRRCSDKSLQGPREGNKYISNKITGLMKPRHQLVASLFCVNPRPNYFTEIDHIDENKLNNNANQKHF